MDREYYGTDIYYQKKSEFIKGIFAWSLFLIAIIMLFIREWELYNRILQVMVVLVFITLLMFITHSYNINPKPIQKIIKINIIIMLSVFMLQMVPLEDLKLINYLVSFSAKSNSIEQWGYLFMYNVLYII